MFRQARNLLHLRYIRAAVLAISVAAILGSLGACTLILRHDVSLQAVLRYFARGHYRGEELTRLVLSPATAAQLEELFASDTAVNPGGLVYAYDGSLHFYRHVTQKAMASRAIQRQNQVLYAALTPLFFRADVENLIRELNQPATRKRLERHGVSQRELAELARELRRIRTREDRSRLRWKAGRLILHFRPYWRDSYELTFDEKLRFYEGADPQGRFVGVFEVFGLALAHEIDESRAHELSRHSHYIAITRNPGRSIVLEDYYRGGKTEYTITPVTVRDGGVFFTVVGSS